MKNHFVLTIVSAVFWLNGCGLSKISTLPVINGVSHSVQSIALAPEGGLLAEAVGIELSNKGYEVIDASATSKLLARLNMNELEIANPQMLGKLKEKGIDAYLTVKGVGGYDGNVTSATARVTSTHSQKIIAGIIWQNAWGGAPGSPADGIMRKRLVGAAQEIAEALSESLPMQ